MQDKKEFQRDAFIKQVYKASKKKKKYLFFKCRFWRSSTR